MSPEEFEPILIKNGFHVVRFAHFEPPLFQVLRGTVIGDPSVELNEAARDCATGIIRKAATDIAAARLVFDGLDKGTTTFDGRRTDE